MDLRFTVDMRQASVRNVALFLGGLSLIRDGLEVMADHGVERLLAERKNEFVVIVGDGRYENLYHALPNLLRRAGKTLIAGGDWRSELPEAAGILVSDLLLGSRPPKEDLRLETLKRGSLEGVISDIFRTIFNRFGKVFRASNSILPGHEGYEMEATLRDVYGESEAEPETKDLGIGIIAIGVEMLRRAYAHEGVTSVEVSQVA
ncbi:MAG: hypothetical protein AABN34_04265 [Acidobacteriota bacterium]